MKVKSILASLGACAIAMSAMALSASAEVLSKTGNGSEGGKYAVPLDGIDVTKIDKIVAEVSVDSDYVKGTIGFNEGGTWVNHGGTADNGTAFENAGKWELANAKVDEGSSIEVQIWWINPVSDGVDGTAKIESVKLYDKDGKELSAGAGDDNKTDDNKTDNTTATTAATTKANTTKAGATKTGDAGVGIAISGLALAGIAAVASRKKH